MIRFVANFMSPHQRQSKTVHGTMAPQTKELRANSPNDGTVVSAELEIVPNNSITPTIYEYKECQYDEANPQDESTCENEQVKLNIDQPCTKEDLDSLKIDDPFMYYSIPAVKKAEYFCQQVDVAILKKSGFRRNVSCPARMETEEFLQPMRVVRRKSCISFECHSTAVFSSYLDDIRDEGEEENEIFDENDILDLLNAYKWSQTYWKLFFNDVVVKSWEK